jgi:hypothetical protein
MGDAWISSNPSRKVITPRRRNVTRVSELIDTVTRTWDEEKLRSVFFSVDVGRIIKILLAVGMMGDFVSWNYTRTGIFSVRLAYFTEWDHQHGRKLLRMNAQSKLSINPVWENIWSLRVPAKVKIFSWKLLHGTLAVRGYWLIGTLFRAANVPFVQFIAKILSCFFFQMPQSC